MYNVNVKAKKPFIALFEKQLNCKNNGGRNHADYGY